MIPRFSVIPRTDFVRVAERVLVAAEQDPLIAILPASAFGQTLVFCPSADAVGALWTSFRATKRVSVALCTLTLAPHGAIAVDADGADDSTARLAHFFGGLLPKLGPCQIRDDETGDDITATVAGSARILFESQEVD